MIFDYWALPRPMTKTWGSGKVWPRICEVLGTPDVAFGKTDGIPDSIPFYDLKNGYDWKKLPCKDDEYLFGYWDPPYDKLYKPEGQEIWRTVRKLAILHPIIYPTSWFSQARRTGMIAITMGPLKAIRCLQIFEKKYQGSLDI